jgi:hypothetical protein
MKFKFHTQSQKCKICLKTVYLVDAQFNFNGNKCHKACSKCFDCKSNLNLNNYVLIQNDGCQEIESFKGEEKSISPKIILLCKTHYLKRLNETGGIIPGEEKFTKRSDTKSTFSTLFVSKANANGFSNSNRGVSYHTLRHNMHSQSDPQLDHETNEQPSKSLKKSFSAKLNFFNSSQSSSWYQAGLSAQESNEFSPKQPSTVDSYNEIPVDSYHRQALADQLSDCVHQDVTCNDYKTSAAVINDEEVLRTLQLNSVDDSHSNQSNQAIKVHKVLDSISIPIVEISNDVNIRRVPPRPSRPSGKVPEVQKPPTAMVNDNDKLKHERQSKELTIDTSPESPNNSKPYIEEDETDNEDESTRSYVKYVTEFCHLFARQTYHCVTGTRLKMIP